MNNFEIDINGGNGIRDVRFEHAQRIVGEQLRERLEQMQKNVEIAETMQRNFIFGVAKDLSDEEKNLLRRTKGFIGEFYEKKFNQLGAMAMGDHGSEVKGLQFDGKIGEASCCAERRALFNFIRECKPGERPSVIATARRDEILSGAYKRQYTESVGPCALCRDALSSLNDQVRVIQPIGGEMKTVPVSVLYPLRKFLLGTEGQDQTGKEYRELLLQISQNFSLTDADDKMIVEAKSSLESKVSQDPKNRVLVAAIGFSGKLYTNSTPQLTRNPQSLIVDRPVEFQLVCEASENHDQLLTLIVLRDSKEKGQEVMLPSGVSRELIRQFHPLTNVIVDFGKDGFKKLPIEILYPLVYKLRKRNRM